ncbi:MAG: hypothetical protein BAJALOKI1v1_820011 [Promethearchaeota archaeon]|nr:MAG: hypothetical protein BAJALOKI1v1_820011 [Candidatus Lokiarchaeota archaeon]
MFHAINIIIFNAKGLGYSILKIFKYLVYNKKNHFFIFNKSLPNPFNSGK